MKSVRNVESFPSPPSSSFSTFFHSVFPLRFIPSSGTQVELTVLPSGRFHLILEERASFAEMGEYGEGTERSGRKERRVGINFRIFHVSSTLAAGLLSREIIALLIARMNSFQRAAFRGSLVRNLAKEDFSVSGMYKLFKMLLSSLKILPSTCYKISYPRATNVRYKILYRDASFPNKK